MLVWLCLKDLFDFFLGNHPLLSHLFREVLESARARALSSIRRSRNKVTILKRALNVVVVPNLVQGTARATKSNRSTVLLLQSVLNIGQLVLLGAGRLDAGSGQPLVSRKGLEECDSLVEEVHGLLAGLVVGVAARLKGANASSVLAPFVLPEGLVITLVILPVSVHVVQGVISTEGLQNVSDVGVSPAAVTLSWVAAIAVVGPEAVNGPGVFSKIRSRALFETWMTYHRVQWQGWCPRIESVVVDRLG